MPGFPGRGGGGGVRVYLLLPYSRVQNIMRVLRVRIDVLAAAKRK